jgi:hypothetical protein
MKHAVFMLMYNTTPEQLKLSAQTFESIVNQDIGQLDIFLFDNGSHPEVGTMEWVNSLGNEVNGHALRVRMVSENESPIRIANDVSERIYALGHEKILGVPNDVILPRNLYSQLVKWPRGMVSAHMDGPLPPDLPQDHEAKAVHEDLHMSVMLTRKWAYDALVSQYGFFFDPGFFMYASDCDLKLRMAACGIRGIQTDIQCWHYGSACWRLAKPKIGAQINEQADRDRGFFYRKYGFQIGSPQYEEALKDLNFKG